MRRFMVFVFAALLAAPAVFSGELAGVQIPDQITVSGKTLQLNGMGVRKKLWIKVYVAGFYLENRTSNPEEAVNADEIKRIVMHFKTNKATKKKMDSAWQEGFEGNAPAQVEALQQKIDTFKGFFGNMRKGDVVELTILPGEGTKISLNGQEKGTITGDDFSRALLKIWFGPKPPSEKLKAGLLGK